MHRSRVNINMEVSMLSIYLNTTLVFGFKNQFYTLLLIVYFSILFCFGLELDKFKQNMYKFIAG